MEIPTGHQAIMPYLMLDNAIEFIGFLINVFGAEISAEQYNEDGTPAHCEANIGGSTIMFSSARGEWKPTPANMFVYVGDADATVSRALVNGATVVTPVTDLPYGRSGGVKDQFGNVWWVTTPTE